MSEGAERGTSEHPSEQSNAASEHPSEQSNAASEHPSEQSNAASGEADHERPVLRVVKGEPSEEELAALIAVVAARTSKAGESDTAATPRSRWGDPAYAVRPVLTPGPDGWRRSAFPR